jgi:hypothetical protein
LSVVLAGTEGGPQPLFLYRGATASFIQGFSQAAKTAAARTARIQKNLAAVFITFLLIRSRT